MRFVFNRKMGGVVERSLITVISGTVALATSDYLNDLGKGINGLVNVIAISMLGGALLLKKCAVDQEEIIESEEAGDPELDLGLYTPQSMDQKWVGTLKKLDYFKLLVIPFAASLDFLGEYENPAYLFEGAFASFAIIFAVEMTYYFRTRNFLDSVLKLGLTGVSIGSVAATYYDRSDITSNLWKGGTACALFLTASQIRQVRNETRNKNTYSPALLHPNANMKSDNEKFNEQIESENQKSINGV